MKQSRVLDRPNVLVVGGAGFLGSHLCEALLEKNNVICVDNYSSGYEGNIDHLLVHPHFEFIRRDCTEKLDFKEEKGTERFRIAFVGVSEIYHLACPASPRSFLKHPVEMLMASSAGVKNVLDLAVEYRSKVVYLSDALALGTETGGQEVLDDSTEGSVSNSSPQRAYISAKRFAERLIEAYRVLYTLETKVIRLGMTYGPHMHLDDGRPLPEFIARALSHRDILLPGGAPASSFLYVSDAVDAFRAVMEYEGSGTFIVAHASPSSLQEAAEKVIALTEETRSKIVQGAGEGEEALLLAAWKESCRTPSIHTVREKTGWFPVVLLDEGLRKTIDYMKSLRGVKGIAG